MIELKEPAVMERIDMTLRRFGLPPIARASIRSAVKDEILKTVNETIETVKLIDIVILNEEFGFGEKRLNAFIDAGNSLMNEEYGKYGMDTIFALQRRLRENNIEYEISITKSAEK